MERDKRYYEDDDVVLIDVQVDTPSYVPIPENGSVVGDPHSEDLEIYISRPVYEKIEEYAKSDTSRELGGLLLGNLGDDHGKDVLIINAILEAKYADSTSSSLTFTHKSWEHMYQEKDALHPDKTIIGWFHTHPRYGIFLSGQDMFIQKNYFNLPWQIAYVVDPVNDARGFFRWNQGSIEKCNGFYIFDSMEKLHSTSHDNKKKEEKHQVEPPRRPSHNSTKNLASKNRGNGHRKYKKVKPKHVMSVINMFLLLIVLGATLVQFTINEKNTGKIDELKSKLTQNQPVVSQQQAPDDASDELQSILNEQKDVISDSSSKLDELDDKVSQLGKKRFQHTIQRGETLVAISKAYYNDASKYKLIMRLNNIEDPNDIKAGDILVIEMLDD